MSKRLTKKELLNTIVVLVEGFTDATRRAGGKGSECYVGDCLEAYIEQAIDGDLSHISEQSKRVVDEVLSAAGWRV